MLGLLTLLMTLAIPRVLEQGAEFAHKAPTQLKTVAMSIKEAAARYEVEPTLAEYINRGETPPPPEPEDKTNHQMRPTSRPESALSTQPTSAPAATSETFDPREIQVWALEAKIKRAIFGFIPGGGDKPLPELLKDLVSEVVGGTLQFLLAVLLSFLIVLDFDHIKKDLKQWGESPVGRFFSEASASVIHFSEIVGRAFQCQMVIALLNASITGIGLLILGIEPLLLLTTIVFLFGMIPVLGVFISSVPIVLIAFNMEDGGLGFALMAVGMIFIVHMLEAYVFNPRIYAARFHLNPVVVLIILLVAHKLAGVWGMLLGIPITHYILNIAQAPGMRRRFRAKDVNLEQS
jgi:predicted PurR-regulated permease PerM